MKKLSIYDPALCCSTGVCGVDVDQNLVDASANVDWPKSNDAEVERFNLSQQPMAFVENADVKNVLDTDGSDALPVLMLDGEIVLKPGGGSWKCRRTPGVGTHQGTTSRHSGYG